MERLKVAGVVVFYQPTDEDISNISSYLADLDILYVMDNSMESNEKRIPQDSKITYIFNHENLGIAGPLNQAASLARKAGYHWLLTMDQDTHFPSGVLSSLKERILEIDTTDIGIVTPWHKTKLKVEKPKENISYPLDVMTSGNLVNLDIQEKIGGFKEWLFIDGVDIEYCLNLRKNGYRVLCFNDLEIDHNLGDIFYRRFLGKDLLVTNHSAMRRYYQARNYHYIRDMYLDIEKEFCQTLVKFKSILLAIVLYENKKWSKIWSYYRGYRDYKKGKRGKSYE